MRYTIQDGTECEIGVGTYTASGTTLSRSVLESFNTDAAINLSGTATVFVTAAASDVREAASVAEFCAALMAKKSAGAGTTTANIEAMWINVH